MPRNPRTSTAVAFALIAAGLTGTIVDNEGKAGLALFVAGAAGALFLIGRQLVGSRAPVIVPKVVGGRTIAVAVVATGVLLSATNVFKANDDDALSRALNYTAWYGFLLLAISLAAVTVATLGRWLTKPTVAQR